MIPWWHDGTLLWERLTLGGIVIPGLAAVETEVERKLDIQLIKGGDGATIADEGYIPAPVQIAIKMWLRDQWRRWLEILPQIHPRIQGGPRTPLEIEHPATDALWIENVYLKKISSPRGEGGGPRVISIEAVQWFPGPKAVKTTAKSKVPKIGEVANQDFDIPGPGDAAVALNI